MDALRNKKSKNKSKTKSFFKSLFPNHSNCTRISKSQVDDTAIKTIDQSSNKKKTISDETTMISDGLKDSYQNSKDTRVNGACDEDSLCANVCNITLITAVPVVAASIEVGYDCNTLESKFSDPDKVDHLAVYTDTNESKNRGDYSKEEKTSSIKRNESTSSWGKIRAALLWIPFIQQCSKYRYPWIQIAGHQGNFKPGDQGTVLKKHCGRESICLQMMSEDNLSDFVPKFKGDVYYEEEKYICMQDLLTQFHMPSLMDIKMGTRTYLEEELSKANTTPKPRRDMYEKMIAVDKDEPTEEEHRLGAVIKSRYMQWRESLSSTLVLGFRIEGIKKSVGTQSRNYKRTRDRPEVKESLFDFVDNDPDLTKKFIGRLESLRTSLRSSNFFYEHEFIGSSLLFVHDSSGKANVWMIDFGKTIPVPKDLKINHISPWIEGNHEDGYLFGLDNLLNLLIEIHSELVSNNSH